MNLTLIERRVNREGKEVDTEKGVSSIGFPGVLGPKLKCPLLGGKNCEKDKFAFKNVMAQFENCIIHIASKRIKLQLLKSFYLTGHNHMRLTINDENYDVAIVLLNENFLDKQFIINEIFHRINERTPARMMPI